MSSEVGQSKAKPHPSKAPLATVLLDDQQDREVPHDRPPARLGKEFWGVRVKQNQLSVNVLIQKTGGIPVLWLERILR